MQITKALYDEIAPGEIFRTVTTRFQSVYEPLKTELTFVCIKGKGASDWAIYCSLKDSHPTDIARYGDKVTSEANIRSICPCDDEVFELYRQ